MTRLSKREKGQKEKIRQVVDITLQRRRLPTDPEKNRGNIFMTEVARGEQMCQDSSDRCRPLFLQGPQGLPQPRELINIYDK